MDYRSWESGTFATLFSGGEGWGVGAVAAGLRPLWGIEHDAEIAAVANSNLGGHVHVADVQRFDPDPMPRPEFLHASPPCPNFSNAKQGASETERDVALGRATARFIEALLPRVFTLENVWMYRRSTSWGIIADTLNRCGYWFDLAYVNAADFGVPQTRKRMIVRAVRGAMVPPLPVPEPWRGWYQAVEDLIHGLPETEFAPWQLARMDEALRETVLLSQGISRDHKGNEYGVTMRKGEEPAFTVTANWNQNGIRAFLVGGQYAQPNGSPGRSVQTMPSDQPAFTVTASNKGDWRAFLQMTGARSSHPDTGGTGILDTTSPANTVCQKSGDARAFVDGRIVQISVRCLARWQTFPDSYDLPEKSTLASRVIGNAVPCLLAEKLLRQLR